MLTDLDPSLIGYQLLKLNLFLHGKVAANNKLWYLDSHCSKHMTGDASLLTNLNGKYEGFVTCVDDNRGKILVRRDIDDKDSLIINDVLLVEGLKHNLLSIS